MDKRENIAIFEDTMNLISEKFEEKVQRSIEEQEIYKYSDDIEDVSPRYEKKAIIRVTKRRTLEAARIYGGYKVCALNFASSTHPGGGVKNGSFAQEESICRISTLYPCLNSAKTLKEFYEVHSKEYTPLGNSDLIYTPNVVVLKEDFLDYKLLDECYDVNIITCAAPNLSKCSDEYSDEEIQKIFEERFERILKVAALKQNEVVILGAFGCGAFANKPLVVAEAANNVIQKYLYHFKTIEFAIYDSKNYVNYLSFKDIIEANDDCYLNGMLGLLSGELAYKNELSDVSLLSLRTLRSLVNRQRVDVDDLIDEYHDVYSQNSNLYYGLGFKNLMNNEDTTTCVDNSSLRLIFPLVYYLNTNYGLHVTSDVESIEMIKELTHLTNNNQISEMASSIYLSLANQLMENDSLIGSIKRGLTSSLEYFDFDPNYEESVKEFEALKDPNSIRGNMISYSNAALSIKAIIYCLWNGIDFKDTIMLAHSLGDQTIMPLVGALAGLYYGVENIPGEWLDKALNVKELEEIIGDLGM